MEHDPFDHLTLPSLSLTQHLSYSKTPQTRHLYLPFFGIAHRSRHLCQGCADDGNETLIGQLSQ